MLVVSVRHSMNKITGKGWVVGIITWLAIIWYATTQTACLKTKTCDGDDLFLFAVIGIGMLAPAGIVAFLVSNIFKK